jgi:hypothetical protein
MPCWIVLGCAWRDLTTSRATLAQKHHLEEEVGKIKGGEGRSRRRDSLTLVHATRSDGESAEPKHCP